MERDDKIRVAITAGIVGAILLILVLYLALSGNGKKSGDGTGANDVEFAAVTDNAGKDGNASGDVDANSSDAKDDSNKAADKSSDSKDIDVSNKDAGDSSAERTTAGKSTSKVIAKKSVSGNSLYRIESAEVRNVYKSLAIDINAQMNEMASYWSDGNMDAVRDLAGLDRFEAMSYKLNGTKDFLYCGDVNSDGKPDGKGLACYADDQYYYGDWSNGVRSGQGTWISYYPDYNEYVVKEHMYTGGWLNDLPTGEGQEHIDYIQDYMNDKDIYVQNAIGNFSNGLYNGHMYIITVNNNYETKEWYGDCENGTWKQVINTSQDKEGRSAVMDEKDNAENHIWLVQEKMKDNGIHGIITGGNVVKK